MLARFNRYIKQHLVILIICLSYLLIISHYWDFVPMWDSWDYLENFMFRAVLSPFNIFNFDFGDHIASAFGLTVSFSQYIDLGNTFLLHFTTAIIMILSFFSFRSILNWLIGNKGNSIEVHLISFLYLFFPPVIGSTLQTNPDNGILAFFIIFVSLLLKKRYWFLIPAGLLLIFSKETGLAIYLGTLFIYFFFIYASEKYSVKEVIRWIIKHIYILIPLAVYILYIAAKAILASKNMYFFVWLSRVIHPQQIGYSNTSNNFSLISLSYFLLIFIINFNWILSFFAYSELLYWIYMIVRTIKNKEKEFSLEVLKIGFLYTLLMMLTVIFYLYKTFGNPRYFLSAYPILILLFYKGFMSIVINISVRRVLLIIVVIIFLLTNFRTVDPVSKKIYGTFKFGNHNILNMTSITGECCGYGRDQLVYNLEYTNIHYILNDIFADIKPDENTVFAFVRWEGPFVLNRLEEATFKRTLRKTGSITIDKYTNQFIWQPQFLPLKPQKVFFIEFPNNNPAPFLADYKSQYKITVTKEYDRRGYRMKVYTLELKKN